MTGIVEAARSDEVHDAVVVLVAAALGPAPQPDHRGASAVFSGAPPEDPPGGPPGKSPSGAPLPSQLRRLTRPRSSPLDVVVIAESDVCRCLSALNVSTATGAGRPLASPNGPDSYIPGPSSKSSEQPISSSSWARSTCAVGMT